MHPRNPSAPPSTAGISPASTTATVPTTPVKKITSDKNGKLGVASAGRKRTVGGKVKGSAVKVELKMEREVEVEVESPSKVSFCSLIVPITAGCVRYADIYSRKLRTANSTQVKSLVETRLLIESRRRWGLGI